MTLRPLGDVARELVSTDSRIGDLDDLISAHVVWIERWLRDAGVRRVVSVHLDDDADLAWSGARGQWRLVVRDRHPDGAVTPLLSASREERVDVFRTGAMRRLIDAARPS